MQDTCSIKIIFSCFLMVLTRRIKNPFNVHLKIAQEIDGFRVTPSHWSTSDQRFTNMVNPY